MLGMRKAGFATAVLVVAMAAVAGGCRTDREITEPEPVPVTAKRLAAALLDVEDVAGTFADAEDATPIATELIPEHECDDAISDLEPEEEASVDFTAGGVRLSSTVAYFPGRGGAVDQLYRDLAEDCEAVVVPSEDLDLRTEPLDFGVLSDDTLALKVEAELASGAIEERDLILMREGDLVSLVRLTGPRPSDKELLDRVVRVAIGRLGLLHEDTT